MKSPSNLFFIFSLILVLGSCNSQRFGFREKIAADHSRITATHHDDAHPEVVSETAMLETSDMSSPVEAHSTHDLYVLKNEDYTFALKSPDHITSLSTDSIRKKYDFDLGVTKETTPGKNAPGQRSENGYAIAGFAIGITGIPFVTIAGLALSIKGLRSRYKGLAIAGLILNLISVVITFIYVLAFIMFGY